MKGILEAITTIIGALFLILFIGLKANNHNIRDWYCQSKVEIIKYEEECSLSSHSPTWDEKAFIYINTYNDLIKE